VFSCVFLLHLCAGRIEKYILRAAFDEGAPGVKEAYLPREVLLLPMLRVMTGRSRISLADDSTATLHSHHVSVQSRGTRWSAIAWIEHGL
jgi:hypothetical protein